MNRLERFREERRIRQKICCLLLFFLILLITGICAADYSVNGLMNNQHQLSIVTFQSMGNYVELGFMNHRIYIDTERMKKDFAKVMQSIQKLLP